MEKTITILGNIGVLIAFISVFVRNQGEPYWLALRVFGFSLALIRIFYDLYEKYK